MVSEIEATENPEPDTSDTEEKDMPYSPTHNAHIRALREKKDFLLVGKSWDSGSTLLKSIHLPVYRVCMQRSELM